MSISLNFLLENKDIIISKILELKTELKKTNILLIFVFCFLRFAFFILLSIQNFGPKSFKQFLFVILSYLVL